MTGEKSLRSSRPSSFDADDDGPVVCYSARAVTRSLTGSTAMYRIIFV
jgi:hypothetical protein